MLRRKIPASFSATEQQDIVRSILILQQQQSTHSDSDLKARSVEREQEADSADLRCAKETDPSAPTPDSNPKPHATGGVSHGIANPQAAIKGIAIPESSKKSSQGNPGMSTLSGVESEAPVGPLPDDRASHDEIRANVPLSLKDAKVEELYMYHVCPDVKAGVGTFEITWSWSNIRVSEDEISERLAKNQADGLRSLCDMLETLDASERSLITKVVNWFEPKDRQGRVTVLSLKRTVQDLQQGRIVFKSLPSFYLIIKCERPKGAGEQDEFRFGQSRTVDLSRPTYVKVHREHLCPETLDEYELPWEWDKVSIVDTTCSLR